MGIATRALTLDCYHAGGATWRGGVLPSWRSTPHSTLEQTPNHKSEPEPDPEPAMAIAATDLDSCRGRDAIGSRRSQRLRRPLLLRFNGRTERLPLLPCSGRSVGFFLSICSTSWVNAAGASGSHNASDGGGAGMCWAMRSRPRLVSSD